MSATEWFTAIAMALMALATLGMGIWCARLLGMIERLARQSARMRRRAIRAEAHALILSRAVEDLSIPAPLPPASGLLLPTHSTIVFAADGVRVGE